MCVCVHRDRGWCRRLMSAQARAFCACACAARTRACACADAAILTPRRARVSTLGTDARRHALLDVKRPLRVRIRVYLSARVPPVTCSRFLHKRSNDARGCRQRGDAATGWFVSSPVRDSVHCDGDHSAGEARRRGSAAAADDLRWRRGGGERTGGTKERWHRGKRSQRRYA